MPGRFEIVSAAADEPTVVVDYAHTDDALRNLLETARPLAKGRLITVFGCGGDRDRTKRPLMGAVAGRLSDVIIVTSDNPRSEDPGRIIEDILRGITPDTRRDGGQKLRNGRSCLRSQQLGLRRFVGGAEEPATQPPPALAPCFPVTGLHVDLILDLAWSGIAPFARGDLLQHRIDPGLQSIDQAGDSVGPAHQIADEALQIIDELFLVVQHCTGLGLL